MEVRTKIEVVMHTLFQLEFRQVYRNPIWPSIIAITILVSIVLPRSSITDLTVIPGMVYFIMVMSLILFIYGSERARMEINQQIVENISISSRYRNYVLGKLAHWFIFSLFIYLIFYSATIGYIGFVHHSITVNSIYESVLYTLLCWWTPFFFALILGYTIYNLVPNIYSYLIIVFIWFFTMPYNVMISFIPRRWTGWMINGDPNIVQIFSTHPLESLEVNKGYYAQRIFMLLVIISMYLFVCYRRSRQIKRVSVVMIVLALCIPMFSPYVPYITGSDSLGSSKVVLHAEPEGYSSNFQINNYSFKIDHGESNHNFRYSLDMEIDSQTDQISFVLLDDFKIDSVKMNNTPLAFQRLDDLILLGVPKKKGILHWEISTTSYGPIGPTTVQLIATTAWYPMSPLEAKDPYKHGRKEQYTVFWDSPQPNKIWTNLKSKSDNRWAGSAYGPTILMGKFEETGNIVYPRYETRSRAMIINQGMKQIFQNNNKKYKSNKELPPRLYYVTTFYGMQVNPDEAYIYPDVYPTEDIMRFFYTKEGDK